jgi:hypothetical protein
LMRYRWNPEEAVKNVSELLQVQKYEQSVAWVGTNCSRLGGW